MDGISPDRLWRSLKHEDIYLGDYQCVAEGRQSIDQPFSTFYKP
jgi:hypothetical protein